MPSLSANEPCETEFSGSEGIESLMDRATGSLSSGRFIESERISDEALHRAWKSGQYGLMSRILLPLQEARRQRRLAAAETGKVFIVEEGQVIPGSDEGSMASGCYVVMPPNVAADARQIRMNGLAQGVSVMAFACEPRTQAGLLPVAVVGPCALRTRLKPVKTFAVSWCLEVVEALASEALMYMDRTRPIEKQVDILMDYLDALPESEEFHLELAEAAKSAAGQGVVNESS